MKIKDVRNLAQQEFGTHAWVSRSHDLGVGYTYEVSLGSKIIGLGRTPLRALIDARKTMADPQLRADLKINTFCEKHARA